MSCVEPGKVLNSSVIIQSRGSDLVEFTTDQAYPAIEEEVTPKGWEEHSKVLGNYFGIISVIDDMKPLEFRFPRSGRKVLGVQV